MNPMMVYLSPLWLMSTQGKPIMDFPDFFDALFELADIWCDKISAQEYSRLLSGILEDARKQKGMFTK